MNQDESLIIDEIYLRASKLVSNTDGDLKNDCILYTANTMQRIVALQQMQNDALRYFLLSFLLASTRLWNQFYNQRQGLIDFIDTIMLETIEYVQHDMFDRPPDILDQPIDLQPMRGILYQNIDILSVICQKKIAPEDIERFMKFNKVFFFKFEDETQQNLAAQLYGLSTFDGKITYINCSRKGKDQIDTYLHEFCHNFYRFMIENNQPGCLSPINNKSLRISKRLIENRQQFVDKRMLYIEFLRKNIDFEKYQMYKNEIDKRIITNDMSLVYVESGDFFDFHVLKKAIQADPYSLLINIPKKN